MNKVAVLAADDADDDRIARDTAPALLAWYDRHRRDLPWRAKPGDVGDPYRVWLSEIMLQQTTVAAVKPYFAAFVAAWPTVEALAQAPLDDILKAWAGLGYYSRARNLHACAREVVDSFGGHFPDEELHLRGLPGIGRYTAAAVAAIAFERRAVVVDGNVERVMARLFGIETPLPLAKPILHAAMNRVTPPERIGDFAQAVMDLGATICVPRTPACGLCPLMGFCRAQRRGIQATLPRKAPKKAVPHRTGAVLVVRRSDGALLVRQRPAQGLFGGMTEFPTTPWLEAGTNSASPAWPDGLAVIAAASRRVGQVHHGLTHFSLELQVYLAEGVDDLPVDGSTRWISALSVGEEALPTLMRKVWLLVQQRLDARVDADQHAAGSDADLLLPLPDDLLPIDPRPSEPGPDAFRTRPAKRQRTRRRAP